MAVQKLTGQDIAAVVSKKGMTPKNVTRTSLQVLVKGNRLDAVPVLIKLFEKQKAVYDKNASGSSIGAVIIDGVKVLIKAEGRTGGLDVELAAIQDLQQALSGAIIAAGGPISIKLGSRTVKGIAGVQKTNGTPKSDFNLCDLKGKPLIHISHKKGSRPTDFQQWGGITEDRIANHKEVKAFIKRCQMTFGEKIPAGSAGYSTIKNSDLKMMAVFGVEYDSATPNQNRVDVLIQGDPGLKQVRPGIFSLTATGHIHYLDDIPDGGFEPVLAIIYKGDRDQGGIRGARISIYPKAGRAWTSGKI